MWLGKMMMNIVCCTEQFVVFNIRWHHWSQLPQWSNHHSTSPDVFLIFKKHHNILNIQYLIGGFNPSGKILVSCSPYSQYMEKYKKCSKPPTRYNMGGSRLRCSFLLIFLWFSGLPPLRTPHPAGPALASSKWPFPKRSMASSWNLGAGGPCETTPNIKHGKKWMKSHYNWNHRHHRLCLGLFKKWVGGSEYGWIPKISYCWFNSMISPWIYIHWNPQYIPTKVPCLLRTYYI